MPPEPTERLDVLMLLGTVQLRGSSSRSLTLIRHLAERKFHLRIVSSQPVPLGQDLKFIEVRVSRYLNVSGAGRIARRLLAGDLQNAPPELIDIQHRSMHAAGSWLARRLQRPYLVTVHDYLRDRERFSIDPVWCRGVVAISDSVGEELLQRTNIPREKLFVIPSGVEIPPESQLEEVLMPDQNPVIGAAGALEPGKGLRHFLRATSTLLKDFPQALILIAGSGPEERPLRKLAYELGIAESVTFLPNLKEFDSAIRAMDIFVLPSLKQGLGTVMLEAMARRLPVIASDSGGVRCVVTNGTTGLLVPPADEQALADRIRFLLENPERARALGKAARERVVEHFPVDKMVSATLDLYRQALKPTAAEPPLQKQPLS